MKHGTCFPPGSMMALMAVRGLALGRDAAIELASGISIMFGRCRERDC
jgi:hypothetical protein